MPNLLTSDQLDLRTIEEIFLLADEFRAGNANRFSMLSEVGALLFFEPSTRTRIGFEIAAWKLGIKTVQIQETKFNLSMSGAESIRDTIKTLNPYVSFFCIRHPDEHILKLATENTDLPIINCGNGADEHPTQALIDVYTIWRKFGKIDGLKVALIGNLRYSRAAHSLVKTLCNYKNIQLEIISPTKLSLSTKLQAEFVAADNSLISSTTPKWESQDVVYSAGFPPETPVGHFGINIRKKYIISANDAQCMKTNAIIMNPLPRIDEITTDVDELTQAHYFTQNENGLYIRMAILKYFCM